MKKRRPNALKLTCILLALTLVASGAGLWFLRQGYAETRNATVSENMQAVQAALSSGDKTAVQRVVEDASEWLGSENGNLILMDAKGDVDRSLNSNLLGGDFSFRLVISPHYNRWDSLGLDGYGALALILDGNGQILRRFLLVSDPYNEPEDLLSFNHGDPASATLFPALNQPLYDAYSAYLEDGKFSFDWDTDWAESADTAESGATSGGVQREAWMNSYKALNALANGATQADVDNVKRYCEWERDQLESSGDWCAQMVKNRDGSLYALALYENNGATNAAFDSMMARWQLAQNLFPFWAFGLVALVLLMAFWVLRDARKRDFKPALWGILTLLGNVVTLIVYLIVRPTASCCASCGALVKRDYMVCPMCAAPLHARCNACGRAQEDAWVCCPYCGQMREDRGENS